VCDLEGGLRGVRVDKREKRGRGERTTKECSLYCCRQKKKKKGRERKRVRM
jgi:hypothetical protein